MLLGSTEIEATPGENVLPKIKTLKPFDYEKANELAELKASEIVESIILMYLPADFVHSEDYVFQKMEADKLTLSHILVSMVSSEHGIKKLMEEIDNGGVGPRHFEVLAGLLSKKMEIVKHMASFMVIMENNYKSLKNDYDHKVGQSKPQLMPGTDEGIEINEETTKFRGQKGLMSLVQSYIEEAKNSTDAGITNTEE